MEASLYLHLLLQPVVAVAVAIALLLQFGQELPVGPVAVVKDQQGLAAQAILHQSVQVREIMADQGPEPVRILPAVAVAPVLLAVPELTIMAVMEEWESHLLSLELRSRIPVAAVAAATRHVLLRAAVVPVAVVPVGMVVSVAPEPTVLVVAVVAVATPAMVVPAVPGSSLSGIIDPG